MRRVLAALLIVALLAPTVVAQTDDTAEPRIEWSSPWERGQYEGVPDADDGGADWVAEDGTLELEATIHDESAIERVTIRRVYEADVDGQQERDQRTIRLGATERIDETVHAGTHGETSLTISVTDTAGNTHVSRVSIEVEDTTAPTADLSATRIGQGAVRLQGTVRDDTQVDIVRIQSTTGTRVLRAQQGALDLEATTFDFETQVRSVAGESVTVEVVDRAGNTRTIDVPINATSTSTATPTATTTPRPTSTPAQAPRMLNGSSTSTPQRETPTTTATATASNATQTPAGGGGISLGGLFRGIGAIVLIAVGSLAVASHATGGRY